MLLTATTDYINKNIIPALAVIVEAGIGFRIALNLLEAHDKGLSITEFVQKSRNLLVAGVIGVVTVAIILCIKSYF